MSITRRDFHNFNFRPYVRVIIFKNKVIFLVRSPRVVYTKTIMHLSLGESGGYLHLHFGEY